MNLDDCQPGTWVVYRPHHAPAEDGIVVGHRGGLVMVRFYGDEHAKATSPADLESGTGA